MRRFQGVWLRELMWLFIVRKVSVVTEGRKYNSMVSPNNLLVLHFNKIIVHVINSPKTQNYHVFFYCTNEKTFMLNISEANKMSKKCETIT